MVETVKALAIMFAALGVAAVWLLLSPALIHIAQRLFFGMWPGPLIAAIVLAIVIAVWLAALT